jgi:uncharacterized protein
MAGRVFLPETAARFPALIICHGASEHKENYYDLCHFLAARGIATFAIDMHGHGQSGGQRFYVQIPDWVADIRAAIDVLSKHPQIDPAGIGALGLSSGGTAILEAAVVEPRLKTLIALAPTVCNSLSLGHSILFKTLAFFGRIKRGVTGRDLCIPLVHMAKGMHFVADPDINQSVLARIEKEKPYLPLPGGTQSFLVDTIKRVGKITIPVLIIWGEKDEVDPVATGRLLYDALKCKKALEIIPGNGHATHIDRDHEKVFALAASWVLENLSSGTGNTSPDGRQA